MRHLHAAILGSLLAVLACNNTGQGECLAMGGTCLVGGSCPSNIVLSPDCTNGGGPTPGAPVCCGPCPAGTMLSASGMACVEEDAGTGADGGDAGDAGDAAGE